MGVEVSDAGLLGPPESDRSVLDRRVDLTAISWYAVGWVAVVLLAGAVRLTGLRAWPLAPGEAGIAADAYGLLHGGAVSAAGAAQPLLTDLTAFAFFLFGTNDVIARLVPLLAGLATIGLFWLLSDTLGRGPALAAALLAALSPALVFAAERLDGAALLTLCSLLLLLTVHRAGRAPGIGVSLVIGSLAALLPLSHPIGWIALPLVLAVTLALKPQLELPRGAGLIWVLLGFAATILLIATSLLTRPAELTSFFDNSFSTLWNHELANLGRLWHLPLFELLIDELPALVFAVVGVFAVRLIDGGVRVMAGWALAALVLTSLLGDKTTASYALVALPLVLLGGYGLSHQLRGVDWSLFSTYWGIGFAVALLATIAAALSALGFILGFSNASTIDTGINFVLLVVVILGPLLWLTVRLSRGLESAPWPVLILVGVAMLLGLGVRSSTLLVSTSESRAGSILTAGSTAPAVGSLINRLQLVSRDMTDFDQSALDPTGGHGLTIAVDSSIAEPFRWYFRDYPSFQVVANAASVAPAPQVVISNGVVKASPDHTARSFAYQTTLATSLARPHWSKLIVAILDPNQIRAYLGYLIDHRVAVPPAPRQFTLSLGADVAQRLFGVTP